MLITNTNVGKKTITMKPAFVTTLSFVAPYQPRPSFSASAAGASTSSISRDVVSVVLRRRMRRGC